MTEYLLTELLLDCHIAERPTSAYSNHGSIAGNGRAAQRVCECGHRGRAHPINRGTRICARCRCPGFTPHDPPASTTEVSTEEHGP